MERLDDGEVSTFLADEVRPGDALEVQGPIGGWFIWRGDQAALGVAGGSGVVPLIAMLRHARDIGASELLKLAVSARTLAELPYSSELLEAGASIVLTREGSPAGRAAARLMATDSGSAHCRSGDLLRLRLERLRRDGEHAAAEPWHCRGRHPR